MIPSPEQIRAARLSLGMTRVEFGLALGLGGKHKNIRNEVQKWERDSGKKTAKAMPAIRVLKLQELMQS